MQTILGSGGAIGIELAKALKDYTTDIRLVSRNPQKVNDTDKLFSADLLDRTKVFEAVQGSSIVYVTVGFPYNLKVWQQNWPKFIKYVIDACIEYKCKLVFFDNIYMYDLNYLNGMNEETPINPPSKKGKIRAEVAAMIMDKVKEGQLEALIARSADFYGPNIKNSSMLTEMAFKPLSNGKKANWLASLNFKHSFTYTPDAAKATALLGNSAKAFNQVWHLPTASNPFTGKEWIETIAKEMEVKPGIQVASRLIVKIMGLFIPIMREMPEMMYQYDRDYVFNSDKFDSHFSFRTTPYLEGIKEIVSSDY
ncbi:NAD-dependent epimerase/dehydratase family protein [Arenibacter sp. S6351L]|uniref:NAD-dependent epimerase/dehydratase family protein n=1 Tax=Arenibacter sp. S6351L TaxID=2926407 RepID=UPI001FF3D79A|nr:NAD-dependent epimerase/dehydratase family protein [Arenibacter sp. S6351L]MCK0134867.1 NAD-dependent epimerase/dehydratase family protein [Arenibacter sp. S6351L]